MEETVKIHCLYRDFLIFIRMKDMERDAWRAFREYYFDRHREFLSHVWLQYQGYTMRNIRERVENVKKEDYAQIESELKLFDIEENTREVVQHCKNILHDPDPCNVYLFIGFFSPDGFVISYLNRWAICIGLERFRSFKNYDVILSHEYCHYILNKRCGESGDLLPRRLIREGLAVYFSKIAFPGRTDSTYMLLSEGRLLQLRDNYEAILREIRSGEMGAEQLFGPRSENIPPRTGYYVGYRLVQDFVDRTGIADIDFLMKDENQMLLGLS
jgi:uncharacterized protein YjaZ